MAPIPLAHYWRRVMVAAVAGWQARNAYQTSQRHGRAKFAAAAALLVEGKPTEAADAFFDARCLVRIRNSGAILPGPSRCRERRPGDRTA